MYSLKTLKEFRLTKKNITIFIRNTTIIIEETKKQTMTAPEDPRG